MDDMTPTDAVQQLITRGWSEAKIAHAAETSQPTVHRVKHGHRKIDFQLGVRLIRLARDLPAANDDVANDDTAPTEGAGTVEGAG